MTSPLPPQPSQPVWTQCAACGQPASGTAVVGGVTAPYCAAHLAALQASAAAPQDGTAPPAEQDAGLRRENRQLRIALAELTGMKEDTPAVTHIAVASAWVRQWANREASRLIDDRDRQPVTLVPASVVRQRQPPPYLVEGLIPAAPSIGVFFGESGTYKSFLLLNLLLCAGADGAAFLGHPVSGGGLGIYVMGEGQYDAGLRLDAATVAQDGFTDEHLCYVEQAFPLSDETAVDELIARCRALAQERGRPVALVAFDSFADFYGAADSENSNTDMQRLIASMKRIAVALGAVVMANAHTGHGGTDEDGNPLPPPARLRGASRFRQAWDFELMATGGSLAPTKNRYGPLAGAMRYEMRAAGGSLAVGQSAADAGGGEAYEPVPQFPHPCPWEAWLKVVVAVRATPGMSLTQIAKVAGVRKEHAGLALMRSAQAGMMINTGTKSSPKWEMGGGFNDWWMSGGGPPGDNPDPDPGDPDGGSTGSLGGGSALCVSTIGREPLRAVPGTTGNHREPLGKNGL